MLNVVKNQKMRIVFPLILVLSLFAASLAGAEEQLEPGALTTKPPEEHVFAPLAAYNYLTGYGSTVNRSGSGMMMSGYTRTGLIAGFISLDITLQKWTGSSWINVKSINKSAENSNTIDNSLIVNSEESGYYYRTFSTHTARVNGTIEKATTYSNNFLLN
ncbi:hypothetical protein M3231_12415 [Neobacillus mesonae]|nr:hypothetical protein [Neobacillus mesonae]